MSRPTLRRVEAEVAVLRRMRAMCESGLSTAAIARRLNGEGVPSPRGRRWSETGVNNALTCPAHAGLVKDARGDWVPGLHWDQRLWEPEERLAIVGAIRSRVRRFEAVAERHGEAFLLGIARCGECGAPLRWASGAASRYRCLGDRNAPEWRAHVYANGERLTAGVLAHVGALSRAPEILDAAEAKVREAVEAELEPVREELEAARRQADAAWTRKENLLNAIEAGVADRSSLRERLDNAERERWDALERAKALEARLAASDDRERLCREAIAHLRDFPALWTAMTVHERRELLRLCVESLTVACEGGRIVARLKLVAMEPVEIPVLRGRKRWNHGVMEGPEGLSTRRLAVLHHYSLGRPHLETAALMEISVAQVTKTLRDVRRLLGVNTNEEALEMCRETIERNLPVLPLYGEANRRRDKGTLRMMEWQVLGRVARGEGVEAIAAHYNYPTAQVELKLGRALAKAGESDPSTALARAVELDLVPKNRWETGRWSEEEKRRRPKPRRKG